MGFFLGKNRFRLLAALGGVTLAMGHLMFLPFEFSMHALGTWGLVMGTGAAMGALLVWAGIRWGAASAENKALGNLTFHQTLLDASIEGIVVYQGTRYVYANKMAVQMFGYKSPLDILKLSAITDLVAPVDRALILERAMARQRGEKVPDRYDIRALTADGKVFWLDAKFSLTLWDGQPAVQITAVDITKYKQAEAARVSSESQFHRVLEESAIPTLIHRDFKPLFVNQAACDLMGVATPQDVYALPTVGALVAPEYRESVLTEHRKRMAGMVKTAISEFQAISFSGKSLWLSGTASVVTWQGEPASMVFLVDVTQRKEAEEALQASEAQFQRIINEASTGILIHQNFKPMFVNEAICRMVGLETTEEAYAQSSLVEFIAPEYRAMVADYHQARLQGLSVPGTYEFKAISKSGRTMWISTTSSLVNWKGKHGVLSTLVDITQRKEAEESLKASEAQFRKIMEDAQVGIVIHRRLKPLYANKAFCRMLEYDSPEEVLALSSLAVFMPPHEQKRMLGYGEARLRGEETPSQYSFEAITRKGKHIVISAAGSLVMWEGEPAQFGSLVDITEMQHMEAVMKQQQEQFSRMVANVPGWLYRFRFRADGTTSLEYITGRQLQTMSPHSPKEMEQNGFLLFSMIHAEDFPTLEAIFSSKTLEDRPYYWEGRYRPADGSLRWTQISARPTLQDNGDVVWDGMIRDITRQKHMEEELVRARKMESVSLMAQGLAHNFNNILTAISGNLAMGALEAAEGNVQELSVLLTEADRACHQAKELTQQLLTFAKGGEPAKEAAPLQDLVQHAVTYTLRGTRVVPHVSIPDNLPPVHGNPAQIEQIVNNLALNAAQAMPEKGNLWVRADTITVDGRNPIGDLADGEYVRLTIRDDGAGISKENLSRIFDPYFTTKATGTGLGLTTTLSMVAKHKGWIMAESEQGKGAMFTVILPISDQTLRVNAHVAALPSKPAPLAMTGEERRVLLMEDEEMVGQVLAQLLNKLGYQVDQTRSRKETLKAFQAAKNGGTPYQAVVLDLYLQGQRDGIETLLELKEVDPAIRAIVYSGDPSDQVFTKFKEMGFQAALNKPFRVGELKQALEETMVKA